MVKIDTHMNRIYLDYNASTPLDPRVADAMREAEKSAGNPSSIHAEGRKARALLDHARVSVSNLLHCDHRQVVFTSGGTESNNLAILGAARANRDRGKHCITSSIEHSSVLNAFHQLEREGFDVTYVAPTPDGIIPPESVEGAFRPDTILVSVMMANNEIGTLQPVTEIASIAHARRSLFHTDAIQAFGKIPVDVASIAADLVSVSAHKIYGPKGVGALYHKPSTQVAPLLRGGSHEGGLRAGTENVIGIHGMGVAAELLQKEGLPQLAALRDRIDQELQRTSFVIICKDANRLPNTTNFYSPDWKGESMVMAFDLEGIAVSNGSACSAGIIEPSHVIRALGYNEDVARSVIRVSVGKCTTVGEIDQFLRVVHHIEKMVQG